MPPIDWGTLINWVVTGLIGLIFGVIGGYVTYRFDRKRDDLLWERERAKLEQQWKHEREQMELVWQQKLQELQIQFLRDEQTRLRGEILKGIDNPFEEIRILTQSLEVVKRKTELYTVMNMKMTKPMLALLQLIQRLTEDHSAGEASQNPSEVTKELEGLLEKELKSLEKLQSPTEERQEGI